jgi:hypothetical protein
MAPRELFFPQLIDLYPENQCLPKIISKAYSDRNKKNLAYKLLDTQTQKNSSGGQ